MKSYDNKLSMVSYDHEIEEFASLTDPHKLCNHPYKYCFIDEGKEI